MILIQWLSLPLSSTATQSTRTVSPPQHTPITLTCDSLLQEWGQPRTPFELAPKAYYVGSQNLSSLLIDTGSGLILIDAGLAESAEQIKTNIESLGFKLSDIRYLLNSHASQGQAGALAQLKAWSQARLVANKRNAKRLTQGGKDDFTLGNKQPFPPVQTDLFIYNNEIIRLGNVALTALNTPAHLPGGTSWLIDFNHKTHPYRLIYVDSVTPTDVSRIDQQNHPHIQTDLRQNLDLLAAQKADVFMANKGHCFQLEAKAKSLAQGNERAFFDPNALSQYITDAKQTFERQLAQQQALLQH